MAVALLMGCIFIAPFYLEMIKRLSTMQAGIYLIIAPTIMLFVAPVAGRLSDRIGSRVLCSAGAALEGIAFFIFSLMKPDSGMPIFVAALAMVGLAAGLFMAPNNKLVMSHAPDDKQGVASGVYKICLSVGGVLGIAVFPVVIIQTISFMMGGGMVDANLVKHSPEVLHGGFRNMFLFGVCMAIAAFVFSVMADDRKI
jgi:MFS family permease